MKVTHQQLHQRDGTIFAFSIEKKENRIKIIFYKIAPD